MVTKYEGPKIFLAAPFLIPFSQLPAVKKGIKNGAASKFFGPSNFLTALTPKSCYMINAWRFLKFPQWARLHETLEVEESLFFLVMQCGAIDFLL